MINPLSRLSKLENRDLNCQNGWDQQTLETYQRIQDFSLDQNVPLSFSRRLARDNNWTEQYSQRVIIEYKRFVFLAIAAGHPVTPSDQVDQVWHLHLSYTRSYWQDFCPHVLQTELHHQPTKGGKAEGNKFDDWYRRTLESYRYFFAENPPLDIWSIPRDRFGRDLQFARVNTAQNWIIPKFHFSKFDFSRFHFPRFYFKDLLSRFSENFLQFPNWRRRTMFLVMLCVVASAIAGCTVNPLNFNASDFLMFYALLSGLGVYASYRLRNYLRLPDGDPSQTYIKLNPYELAYLVDGDSRVFETALANLYHKHQVGIDTENGTLIFQGAMSDLREPIEIAFAEAVQADGKIYNKNSNKNSEPKFKVFQNYIDQIRDRLVSLGLLLSPSQAFKAQLYPNLLVMAVLGLGVTRSILGALRGRPIGILLVMMGVIGITASLLDTLASSRTRLGDRLVRYVNTNQDRVQDRGNNSQVALTVALSGMFAMMNNHRFVDLRNFLYPPSRSSNYSGSDSFSSNSSGGDSGGDSGGGDSGGGGCGGCGGCGGGGGD